VTDDPALHEKVLTLSNHGRARGQTRQFWADEVGFKYKMSNLQAAIGVGQMERIDELLARKRAIFQRYRSGLSGRNDIALNPEPGGTRNGFWMPTAVFARETGVTRERLQAVFAAQNIDARVFFWPLSGLPAFQSVLTNVNAYDLPGRAINLPSYHDMTHEDIDRVIDLLLNVAITEA
jgi:perosamine synthetase